MSDELTGLSYGELLKILWDEVRSGASIKAQQAHDALLAKLAVQDLDDEMRRSRKRERFSSIAEIGREVVARQAQEMRADWRQQRSIDAIVTAATQAGWVVETRE